MLQQRTLWDAVRLSRSRKVSWFSNQEVIKFLCNWLENTVVPYVPEFVLLTTEGLFWCLVGSGDLVAPS